MRRIAILGFLMALVTIASAQTGNTVMRPFTGSPTGSCSFIQLALDQSTGNLWDCLTGNWNKVGPGSGGVSFYQTVQDEGLNLPQEPKLNFVGTGVTCVDNAGVSTDCTIPGGGGTPPTGTGFTHITTGSQDAAARAVDVSSADVTGVLKASAFPALTGDVTTVAGALATTLATVATAGTGTKVTINAKGLATAVANASLASADFANQGTTTTVLHGNAAGNPSFAGVSLTADTIANQGTTTTLLHGNGAGQPSFASVVSADLNITTSTCTNQFVTAISSGGVGTCTTDTLASAQHANQGTTTTLLHGNGAGNPSFTAVNRVDEASDGRGWAFCGTATSATVTVGPVNASTCCSGGTCRQFQIYYYIEGYSGGTPVGRLLMGPTTPSTTALTNGNALLEGTTTITTTSVSVPGLPLAVTLTAISREGVAWVDGASGKFKRINVIGQEGAQSVSVAPVMYRAASNFSDLSTNLPLQQFQLTVYDTLTSTAASTNTFTAGTYLAVWGRNTD